MKPIYQTAFGGPDSDDVGNCFPSCLASILECDLADVPHFYKDRSESNKECFKKICQWMTSQGLVYLGYDYIADDSFMDALEGCYVVLSGPSPRGDYYHSVVGKIINRKPTIVHDPHSPRTDFSGSLKAIEFIGLLLRTFT